MWPVKRRSCSLRSRNLIFAIFFHGFQSPLPLCNNIAGELSRRKAEKQEYSVTRWRFNNKHFIRAKARLICHNLRKWKRGTYNIKVCQYCSAVLSNNFRLKLLRVILLVTRSCEKNVQSEQTNTSSFSLVYVAKAIKLNDRISVSFSRINVLLSMVAEVYVRGCTLPN